MNQLYDLSGRFGLVTGAASGIGLAAAEHLADLGAGLALVDLDGQGLKSVGRAIEAARGPKPLLLPGDAAEEVAVAKAVEQTMAAFGRIDFLINSAGILRRTPFLQMPVEEWDLMFKVNLRGPLLFCRQVAPIMVKQGSGSIVNVASLAGRSSSILGGAHYTAGKHGLIGLSRHIARELASTGVRVNAFCPGATMTPMVDNVTPPEEKERVAAAIPRGCWAAPEEQAAVIAFLVSDASKNVIGACLDSNGGSLMV